MLFAALEFTDFAAIFAIVAAAAGGGVATASYFRPVDRDRLQRIEHKLDLIMRIEHKLDLIMTHLGLDYTPPPKARWQEMASDPTQKIAAIKAYREQHAVGLAEAKRAVEAYITGSDGRA